MRLERYFSDYYLTYNINPPFKEGFILNFKNIGRGKKVLIDKKTPKSSDLGSFFAVNTALIINQSTYISCIYKYTEILLKKKLIKLIYLIKTIFKNIVLNLNSLK